MGLQEVEKITANTQRRVKQKWLVGYVRDEFPPLSLFQLKGHLNVDKALI